MAGEDGAGIFDAKNTLEPALGKVAYLSADAPDGGTHQRILPAQEIENRQFEEDRYTNSAQESADGAFPRLFRRDRRRQGRFPQSRAR